MYESYIEKIEIVGKLRNLKPGTIRTYQKNVSDFLKFIEKNPEELTCEDARDYLVYLQNKGNKASTCSLCKNSASSSVTNFNSIKSFIPNTSPKILDYFS